MEKIWSESDQVDLKSSITSFPYERKEVEHFMAEFQDAGGKVVKPISKALFRRCSCVDNNGKKRVCVPPKIGWMCRRRGILVRKHFVLESTMVERRRIQNEQIRIDEAVEAANKTATNYLESEEGQQVIRLLAERKLQQQNSQESASDLLDTKQLSLSTIDRVSACTLQSKSKNVGHSLESKKPLSLLTGW